MRWRLSASAFSTSSAICSCPRRNSYCACARDKTPPGPPRRVTKRIGTNLGIQGVEVAWEPGSDNNWVSHYEVLKEGLIVGKAAIGVCLFDWIQILALNVFDQGRGEQLVVRDVADDDRDFEETGPL